MTETKMISDTPKGENFGTDEIGAAFDGLSPDDKLKLAAIETYLLGGTGLGKGDIVHEAVCRALTGQRKCPRKVVFMAFLVETMKSIASHAREKQRWTVVMANPPETVNTSATNSASTPSPEDELIAVSVIQRVHSHFEDDEEAGLVLMGWADGLRGKSLREATGLDQAKLDYAIKRIRTSMRKLYPNGWMP